MDPVQKAVINHTFGVPLVKTKRPIISCNVCQIRFNSEVSLWAFHYGWLCVCVWWCVFVCVGCCVWVCELHVWVHVCVCVCLCVCVFMCLCVCVFIPSGKISNFHETSGFYYMRGICLAL